MNRREFFSFKRSQTPPSEGLKVTRRTNTGLDVYTSTWNVDDKLHLLRRAMFGPSLNDLNAFKGLSLEQSVDKLLDTSKISIDPPINNYDKVYPDADVAYGQTWVNAPVNFNIEFARVNSMKAWMWSLAANQTATIYEKMLLFWHNHFAVELAAVPFTSAYYYYYKVVMDYAMGNFKTFTQQITVDPAMLYYLNGRLNTKNAPDENYARELQELFTLGKGPDSQYTEEDVKAAARILTGFNINVLTSPVSSIFQAARHDSTDKTFSAFYGNQTIKGKTGITAGTDELKELLNMIFQKEEVSKFICRRLYRYFVYYKIDDNAENQVIAPLAKIFRDNNYEIKPVLKSLFMSEHFFDIWNRSCIIKDPLTHSVSFVRQFQIEPPTQTNPELLYKYYSFFAGFTALNQMDLGDPPSVSGWEAWYQLPLYNRSWITSDSLPKRNELQDYLLWIGHKFDASYTMKVDVWKITQGFSEPNNADKLINEACHFLLPMALGLQQIVDLKEILLPGGIPDYNWTEEYDAAVNPTYPNHTTALETVTQKLQYLYKRIMNLSEYQLS